MPSGGGEAIRVTKGGGYYAQETPDGKWIYFGTGGGGSIWKVASTGGEEIKVHPGPLSYGDDFVVLENGIYLSKRDGSLDFLDFASGKSKTIARLESHMLYFFGLTISPDRRWILYTRVYPPATDLMLVENFR